MKVYVGEFYWNSSTREKFYYNRVQVNDTLYKDVEQEF
jgi:hypothetical protein